MLFERAGVSIFAATGGRGFEPGRPAMLFIHGAGFSSPMWSQQSRWFAFHGWPVLAPDLPGHGRSGGAPLTSIGALADWVLGLAREVVRAPCTLIGHSMGALVALEAAARGEDAVRGLGLVGAAARMPVHPDLLAAARANDHAAIDMVNLWGHGARASLGSHQAPGIWMLGIGERLLERSGPGVLYTDLAACNEYQGALEAAARVRCPTVVVSGERDQMTPLKGARQLAAAIPGAELVVLPGAGHMLPAECPDALRAALAARLGTSPATVSAPQPA